MSESKETKTIEDVKREILSDMSRMVGLGVPEAVEAYARAYKNLTAADYVERSHPFRMAGYSTGAARQED